MTMMRAVEVGALAPDLAGLSIVEKPIPVPGPGEVLVRIEAAALGFPDLLMTEGLYQAKPPVPFVPGMEASGTVAAVGDGAGFAVGDEVIVGGLTGGVQQYAVHPAATVSPKPARLSFGQAAGLRAAYLTAYVGLVRCGQARPGDWLLVHGAAGGVGLAAVDMARALGLRVIAVASSEDKLARVQEMFAPEHAILGPSGFREKVLEITGGKGVQIVYDPVGGDVFDESIRCIAFGGRLLVIGFASGRIPEIRANMPLIKGFSVVGVRAGEFGRKFPELGRENIAAIMKMAEDGTISPTVHREVPLDAFREAYAAMRDRSVVGRTIVLPHG